ncbi:nucleoporin Nup37 [Schistocerca nitens]|uniref:nucleoporin Nup37 n=1 Tax=Schistocerca nitens TaxID=7011 RepID=UPI0021173EA4|nr:nucleoporin Nup37 [Schistocerca nitens]
MDHTSATHVLEFDDKVFWFELSPFEWSQNLLCIAFTNKITVGKLRFQEDEEEMEEKLEYVTIKEYHHTIRTHALAWSPETCLDVLPKCLIFASADSDFKVSVFSSDLDSNHSTEVLEGHRDYINCITFDTEGRLLFSGSDDNTMKMWDVKETFSCIGSLNFNSQVMSVTCHRDCPENVLVGLARDVVHLVSIQLRRSLMSFPTNSSPLQMADWAPSNSKSIAALSGGELVVWDISKTSWPSESRGYTVYGQYLKYCPSSENHIAVYGRPDHQVKVYIIQSNKPLLSVTLESSSWISWHFRLPYICAASDRKLCFWKVSTK